MRWFKHLTETRQDEKVARLIADGGHAAYGLWWMVLEAIARQIENGSDKCSITYPVSKWAVELQTSPNNVRKRLTAMVTAGLLQMNCKGSDIELTAYNLLKYRDEWQSRLGSHSGARIQNQNQKQIQKTDSASRAGIRSPHSLTEAERELLEFQKGLRPKTPTQEPPEEKQGPASKEEREVIAHRVFKQLEETPEGAAIVAEVLGKGQPSVRDVPGGDGGSK